MINWRTIRVHNQSQNNAFEELVCQFARHNPPNDSKEFNRLGTPDGGVECYWKLNNGKEIGWQAKYVFSVEDLISQIDKSIKTAIKNHPNMNKYIVAAPFNLPDPQYTGKAGRPIKSAKTKWREKVAYWKEELSTEGNTVEIELWDESYLNDLLINPINEGLRYYWFNGSEFTGDRFKDNLEATIADLGPRYTPELNIELDISFFFDCLLRNERQIKMIQKYHFDLKYCADNVVDLFEHTQHITDLTLEHIEFLKILSEIYEILRVPGYSEMEAIKFSDLLIHLKAFEKNISSIWDKLNDLEKLNFKNSSYEKTLSQMFNVIDEGKTHLASALGRKACEQGYEVRFYRVSHLVEELEQVLHAGKLKQFRSKLEKVDLMILDEMGYLPFGKEGAELLFQIISEFYEQKSLIITSNLEFSQWNRIFSDSRLTAALVDRLIHHAHIISYTGQSFRLTTALSRK